LRACDEREVGGREFFVAVAVAVKFNDHVSALTW
jgi:hypothetical protein